MLLSESTLCSLIMRVLSMFLPEVTLLSRALLFIPSVSVMDAECYPAVPSR